MGRPLCAMFVCGGAGHAISLLWRCTLKIDKRYIEGFIRGKVETEALTDRQIAVLLDVGTSTVSHWRNKFNIKPSDKFSRNFKEKYGPDALDQLDIMVQGRAALQEIADYFGFSREYAGQVHLIIYGLSYMAHMRQMARRAPNV
ncbi:MAG: hypothetical protein A3J10_01130 [Candidatus Sungbacteria bacterium RIFCSPLOWO2_02_FULL_54_10]|uniref:Uncharacterized protein n=1 Tax=Candidatus Sungbacteria bacterium RIFCSPHIGHO2_02_FULL_53_17 TaxID=1802275 RepID=A0A1G2KVZ1_9BACT|nr:MAG: hypothetical protein A3C92_02965 [Candidatus Sungbacteria bacterium RIFCSPHIGHO2_02_FULL_53_17]OHA12717.1 MAG: hypothetical protein A3J10_01130 [Candidatus Sungbacteria bacterium RIFCSPLOWO2_02_FULL_54_10]